MLVLSRMKGERIRVGDDIEVVVLDVRGSRVRLGFIAPDDTTIVRDELIATADWPPLDPLSQAVESIAK